MAEFAINGHVSKTTKVSPFFAKKSYHPRMDFDLQLETRVPRTIKEKYDWETALSFAKKMRKLWILLQEETSLAQIRMEGFVN